MLFLFYVTQMAQISQIFLANGNLYVTQKSRKSQKVP